MTQFSRPIFLIGLPGCGKSTFGRALARRLNRDFIDLDKYIENRWHSSIPDIFTTMGEQQFRSMESRMLLEIAEFDNVVIACGGGTPTHSDNMSLMCSHGLTVWLCASDDVLARRLWAARTRRPHVALLSDCSQVDSYIKRLHTERDCFYSAAHMSFDSNRLEDRSMIGQSVEKFIELISSEHLTDNIKSNILNNG